MLAGVPMPVAVAATFSVGFAKSPLPANKLTIPFVSITRMVKDCSPKYTLPALSTYNPLTKYRPASTAKPPFPEDSSIPMPAIVLMMLLSAVTILILWLP